jgi:DNA-binding NarL/FixJ family response regulator
VKVIGLTRHTERSFVARMFDVGALGYVLKQSPPEDLFRAVREVAAGRRYIDPAVAPTPSADHAADRRAPAAATPEEPLTPVEENVLRLVAAAFSNHDIAKQLEMDAGEVANIKTNAMVKTGLSSRLQVIEYVHARGWR